jgi:hypothetical protein
MMVTGVFKIVPGVGDAHIAQTEAAPERTFDNSGHTK